MTKNKHTFEMKLIIASRHTKATREMELLANKMMFAFAMTMAYVFRIIFEQVKTS